MSVIGRRRKPRDEQRLARLGEMPRRADGTVGVREAARELGIGTDAATRLLRMAGLYRRGELRWDWSTCAGIAVVGAAVPVVLSIDLGHEPESAQSLRPWVSMAWPVLLFLTVRCLALRAGPRRGWRWSLVPLALVVAVMWCRYLLTVFGLFGSTEGYPPSVSVVVATGWLAVYMVLAVVCGRRAPARLRGSHRRARGGPVGDRGEPSLGLPPRSAVITGLPDRRALSSNTKKGR